LDFQANWAVEAKLKNAGGSGGSLDAPASQAKTLDERRRQAQIGSAGIDQRDQA
jgi:hypothetical protein